MASSLSSEMESMDLKSEMESIDCEVCFHQFDETTKAPRTMNCGHTFCTECIGREISSGQITCPFCRKKHNADYASDIPINYSLLKVMKVLKKIEMDSSRIVEKQDGHENLSLDVAIEPQLNAGICGEHGSYKLFWCQTCILWVCRDCTVLDHPNNTCSIISIRNAFTLFKKEGATSTLECQRRKDNHVAILKHHMDCLSSYTMMHGKQLRKLQKMMDDIKLHMAGLENENRRWNRSICSSSSLNDKTIQANAQLQGAITAGELMLLKTKTQKCQETVDNWVDVSEKQLETSRTKIITAERWMIIDWALKVSSIKAANVRSLQPIMTNCLQDAVTEGGITVSKLTELNLKLTICSQFPGRNEVALVTPDKSGVHIHTLSRGIPPANSIMLNYLDMTELKNEPMGFITMECQGKIFGPVYLVMEPRYPETKFFQISVSGEAGEENLAKYRVMINSSLEESVQIFYWYKSGNSNIRAYKCTGFTIGATQGIQGSLEDLMEVNNRSHSFVSSDITEDEVPEKGMCGWVTLDYSRALPCYTIWYKEEEDYSDFNFAHVPLPPKVGKVVKGMEAIRELAKQTSSYTKNEMKVVDCGVYCQADS